MPRSLACRVYEHCNTVLRIDPWERVHDVRQPKTDFAFDITRSSMTVRNAFLTCISRLMGTSGLSSRHVPLLSRFRGLFRRTVLVSSQHELLPES